MTKRDKIIYWVATLWLSLGMTATGIVQLIRNKDEVALMNHIGFPVYLLTWIGICKIFGVIAVLAPGFGRLKEWAYAGFFFCMAGAIYSHIVIGDGFKEIFGPMLLLVLTVVSWYFRPADRKIVASVN